MGFYKVVSISVVVSPVDLLASSLRNNLVPSSASLGLPAVRFGVAFLPALALLSCNSVACFGHSHAENR